jgi:hypothetical protein
LITSRPVPQTKSIIIVIVITAVGLKPNLFGLGSHNARNSSHTCSSLFYNTSSCLIIESSADPNEIQTITSFWKFSKVNIKYLKFISFSKIFIIQNIQEINISYDANFRHIVNISMTTFQLKHKPGATLQIIDSIFSDRRK